MFSKTGKRDSPIPSNSVGRLDRTFLVWALRVPHPRKRPSPITWWLFTPSVGDEERADSTLKSAGDKGAPVSTRLSVVYCTFLLPFLMRKNLFFCQEKDTPSSDRSQNKSFRVYFYSKNQDNVHEEPLKRRVFFISLQENMPDSGSHPKCG